MTGEEKIEMEIEQTKSKVTQGWKDAEHNEAKERTGCVCISIILSLC